MQCYGIGFTSGLQAEGKSACNGGPYKASLNWTACAHRCCNAAGRSAFVAHGSRVFWCRNTADLKLALSLGARKATNSKPQTKLTKPSLKEFSTESEKPPSKAMLYFSEAAFASE